MAERLLVIHNTVRRVGTRLKRTVSPGRQRFVQRIGSIVVRRKRPKTYPERVIKEHLEQLRKAYEVGAIEVREQDGTLVDLGTLKPLDRRALVTNTRPNFLVDSAKNDKNPIRPAKASTNLLEPSPHAQGQTPDLLTQPVSEDDEPEDLKPEPEPKAVADTVEEPSVPCEDEAETAADTRTAKKKRKKK